MYHREVDEYGGSILGSINLCGTFRRISEVWENAQTLNLEKCLLYVSSIIWQFLDFIHIMVQFRFNFLLRDSAYALLRISQHLSPNLHELVKVSYLIHV